MKCVRKWMQLKHSRCGAWNLSTQRNYTPRDNSGIWHLPFETAVVKPKVTFKHVRNILNKWFVCHYYYDQDLYSCMTNNVDIPVICLILMLSTMSYDWQTNRLTSRHARAFILAQGVKIIIVSAFVCGWFVVKLFIESGIL